MVFYSTISVKTRKFLEKMLRIKFSYLLLSLSVLEMLFLLMPTGSANADGGTKWIQVHATPSKQSAEDVAKIVNNRFDNTHAFYIGAGWYVVALGPYSDAQVSEFTNQLTTDKVLSASAEVNTGGHFLEKIYPKDFKRHGSDVWLDNARTLSDMPLINEAAKKENTGLLAHSVYNDAAPVLSETPQVSERKEKVLGLELPSPNQTYFAPPSWVSDRTLSLMSSTVPQNVQQTQINNSFENVRDNQPKMAGALRSNLLSMDDNRKNILIKDLDQPVIALVDKSEQKMRLFVDGKQVNNWSVSTARPGKVTPSGTWVAKWLSKNHRSSIYDNAPMPFAIFYDGNFAIHGTDQINKLGAPASSGCIRLHPEHAKILFETVQYVGEKNFAVRITD